MIESTSPGHGPSAEILYVVVRSSSVAQVGYAKTSATLAIRFHNGAEYHYFDVPEHKYRELLVAPSVGGHFHDEIRDAGYRYACVRPASA